MKRAIATRKTQLGFSIVESMISMSIGLVLLAGITQAFVGSKKTYKLQENLVLLQENGRFVTHFLSNALHMAGYKDQLTSITTPLSGAEQTMNDSDSVTVSFETDTNLCNGAAISTTSALVYKLYVRKNPGTPTLVCEVGGVQYALVENVDDLEILYGEDTDSDGTANRYVTAPVATMANVVSVRVYLLLRSDDDNLVDAAQSYTFFHSTVTATDNRIRRTFTTTARLRNIGI